MVDPIRRKLLKTGAAAAAIAAAPSVLAQQSGTRTLLRERECPHPL